MNFNYKPRTPDGILQSGTVEAVSQDAAVSILQRHGLIIVSLIQKTRIVFRAKSLLGGVKNKDIVIFLVNWRSFEHRFRLLNLSAY